MHVTRKRGVTAPKGFLTAATACGIKHPNNPRLDLACLVSEAPASAAGLLTRNAFAAAPVQLCRKVLAAGKARAVVVNSIWLACAIGRPSSEVR